MSQSEKFKLLTVTPSVLKIKHTRLPSMDPRKIRKMACSDSFGLKVWFRYLRIAYKKYKQPIQ
jgi:hypothetical protein